MPAAPVPDPAAAKTTELLELRSRLSKTRSWSPEGSQTAPFAFAICAWPVPYEENVIGELEVPAEGGISGWSEKAAPP